MSTEPRFIQIHTLHSYPAALLNRDDAGLAKRLPFGNAVRTRISWKTIACATTSPKSMGAFMMTGEPSRPKIVLPLKSPS